MRHCDTCSNPAKYKLRGSYYCFPHIMIHDQFNEDREELVEVRYDRTTR